VCIAVQDERVLRQSHLPGHKGEGNSVSIDRNYLIIQAMGLIKSAEAVDERGDACAVVP
jgi:hypothetical protein